MPESGSSQTTLVRAVGLKGLTASLFNGIVGAGIFVLPATVAGIVGNGAPLAYLCCAVAILFVMLSYASAGSRVIEPGGSYAYMEAAFGPLAGFLGGVMVWLSDTLAAAGVAAAFAAAVAEYVPAAGEFPGRMLLLLAAFGGLAAINFRGVARGATFVEIVTIFKLAPLVLFILAGLALRWHDVPAPVLPSMDALGRATLFLMFAFSGAESVMALSGEIVEPNRTIPRALLLSLGVIALLYGSVHAVAAAALGAHLAGATAAPLADAAAQIGGATLRSILLAGTAVSAFGYLSAVALSTPRTVFAIGRAGVLPRGLAAIHPRFRTPYVAIVTQALITFSLALAGTFGGLVESASIAVLVLYLTVCIAAWRLTRLDVREGGEPFSVPTVVFLVGAVLCLWLIWSAAPEKLIPEGAVLAVAALAFLLRRGRGIGRVAVIPPSA